MDSLPEVQGGRPSEAASPAESARGADDGFRESGEESDARDVAELARESTVAPLQRRWDSIAGEGVALDFLRVAAIVDEELARVPADDDLYRTVKSRIQQLVESRSDPLELMWSYWHDAMHLEQTTAAVARLGGLPSDSIAGRLLSGMQADASRLSAARRMEAYAAAYGIESGPSSQDSHFRQARFTSALSTLFDRATNFFREDDDTTLSADALPLLHALDDLHGLLSDAGDPRLELVVRSTRRDMLVELYALNRPELRPMFPVHPNVTVPEPWMAVVDAVAILEGWTQVSAAFFAELARLGERILLSVRLCDWARVGDCEQAAAWARSWRRAVQIYRLTLDVVDWPSEKGREAAVSWGGTYAEPPRVPGEAK